MLNIRILSFLTARNGQEINFQTRVQKFLGGFPSPNQKTNPCKEEGLGGVLFDPLLNFPAQNSDVMPGGAAAFVPHETQSHGLQNDRAREWKEPGALTTSLVCL